MFSAMGHTFLLHWTTVVATPDGQETYENRPGELRYARTRDGYTLDNTKEVKFLDGAGNGVYEWRSFIRQMPSTLPPVPRPQYLAHPSYQ
ncbi:MAG: hypothetical protein AB8B57_16050 [Congregibacter sp.]